MNLAIAAPITAPTAPPDISDFIPLTEWEVTRWRRLAEAFRSAERTYGWATREYERAEYSDGEFKAKLALEKAEHALRRIGSDLSNFYWYLRISASAVEALNPAAAGLIPRLVSKINVAETSLSKKDAYQDVAPLRAPLSDSPITIAAFEVALPFDSLSPEPESPATMPDIPEALMEEAPEASEHEDPLAAIEALVAGGVEDLIDPADLVEIPEGEAPSPEDHFEVSGVIDADLRAHPRLVPSNWQVSEEGLTGFVEVLKRRKGWLVVARQKGGDIAPLPQEFDSMDHIASDPDYTTPAYTPPPSVRRPAERIVFMPATLDDTDPVILVEPMSDPRRFAELERAYERAEEAYDFAKVDAAVAPPEFATAAADRLKTAEEDFLRIAAELAQLGASAPPEEEADRPIALNEEVVHDPYVRQHRFPPWARRLARRSPTIRLFRWVMNW